MILIQKKRILLLIGFIFISIFVYSLKDTMQGKTMETVSLPVTNKVVILDARSRRRRSGSRV